jgi:hypothetical protein
MQEPSWIPTVSRCMPQSRLQVSVGPHGRAEPIVVGLHNLFNTENAIVEQEDDEIHPVTSHRSDLVCRKLVTSVSFDQYDATRGSRQGCSKGGWRSPTDTPPQALSVEVRSVRKESGWQGTGRSARIDNQDVPRREELLYSRIN